MNASFLPRPTHLRDGRIALLRFATADDAEGFHALDTTIVRAGQGVVQSEEDIEDLETFRTRYVARLNQDPLILAVLDGAVVGEGGLRRFRPALIRHNASLWLSVHPDVQGLGLGKALMAAIEELAREAWPPILRLELAVRADNDRARTLYRRCGFVEEGLRRAFIQHADGSFGDDVQMAKWLGGA